MHLGGISKCDLIDQLCNTCHDLTGGREDRGCNCKQIAHTQIHTIGK